MNYADMKLGTWYPMGGMYKVIDAFYQVAKEQGVTFRFGEAVTSITMEKNTVKGLETKEGNYPMDYVIGSADYHHVDQVLTPPKNRMYTETYWDKRTMAPSSLLFYIGLNKTMVGLQHHNLFFDKNFDLHAAEIYTSPEWPTDPLFYICCPSKTDPSVAPKGSENIFILMPIAPDLEDNEEIRDRYFDVICRRIQEIYDLDIRNHIVYKKSYCVNDFVHDYNAFKGNAYGLANTLTQTAFLKPKMQSNKVKNLYFAGQLTSPGPGMPPSIISGQVAADQIIRNSK